MKTVAIIQARMNSTRLPGKVMLPLGGHKVIDWVVHRVSKSKLVDKVVVAMPEGDIDSELDTHCLMQGYERFYGSEDDVLSRYYHCAKYYDADYVVRITSDCPLIDWDTIDALIMRLWLQPVVLDMKYMTQEAEFLTCHYASNCHMKRRNMPRGLDCEAFTMKMLAMTHHQAHYEYEREHVTPAMSSRKGNIFQEFAPKDYGHLRWTLDEQADYDMLCKLVKHGDWDTPWLEFAKACDDHPEIPKINAHVKQKET
jgi:spore coat polysaccharide biosynthesis protein SpsF